MNMRENYIAACHGVKPEWVPNYMQEITFFTPQILLDPNAVLYGMLEEFGRDSGHPLVAKDCYGIPWTLETLAPMVVPGTCLFEEMSDWRGNFIIPDTEGYDWDKACEEDAVWIEPGKAVQLGFYGQFTQLYNAMGFENAMMAVYDDPDEVMTLFDEMTDFMVTVLTESMKRVKIDSVVIYDDLASAGGMFISKENYQNLVKPFHKRIFDAALKMNPEVSLEMHCCGKCEKVVDDFVEIGTNVWQPAQAVNDLKAIREKYGTKLVFNGGWDNIRAFSDPKITEEEVRDLVRGCYEEYGSEGGLIFWDCALGGDTPQYDTLLEWINDEADKCKYGVTV